jgi:hypothetical protein
MGGTDVSVMAGVAGLMLPYLLTFCVAAFGALRAQRLGWALFLPMALLIGLRHEVGGDWFQYELIFDNYKGISLSELLAGSEPGYALANGLSGWFGWGAYGANLLCAFIFTTGLWQFCRAQPLPWLALTVAIPYLVTVVAMGYTRQGVAIGFGMMALLALENKQFLRFTAYVLLAAAFHKTAVVLLGLALLMTGGGWWWRAPLMAAVSFVAYSSLLADSLDNYLINYEQAGYASQGAGIRVAMNALPALLFLYYRKSMALSAQQLRLWSLLAYAALLTVIALILANSSTAVDRLALYLIPLQLFVWSRIPGVMASKSSLWTRYVVAYSLAVLLVWLVFAGHSFAWLPYQFYPLIWMFS